MECNWSVTRSATQLVGAWTARVAITRFCARSFISTNKKKPDLFGYQIFFTCATLYIFSSDFLLLLMLINMTLGPMFSN